MLRAAIARFAVPDLIWPEARLQDTSLQTSRIRIFDLFAGTTLMGLVLWFSTTRLGPPPDAPRRAAFLLALLMWPSAAVWALSLFGTYTCARVRTLAPSLALLGLVVAATGFVLAVALLVLDADDMRRLVGSLPWLFVPFVAVAVARFALVSLSALPPTRGAVWPTYAVLGAEPALAAAAAALRATQPGRLAGQYAVGADAELMARARQGRVDRVYLVSTGIGAEQQRQVLEKLLPLAVDVSLCRGTSYENEGLVPTIEAVMRRPVAGWRSLLKDWLDRMAAGLLLAILLPPLISIALLIKWTSKGPILFRQPRHGLRNEEIMVYKFRTMRTDMADVSGRRQTQRGDPRITPIGRFLRTTSLDELPQLINVLRGEMSLVGPRPHPIDMRTEGLLGSEISPQYEWRHRVKPGITGWAQVNGSRGATMRKEQISERVQLDNHYIENWSLVLDLKIMIRTGMTLFGNRNAF